MKFQHILFRLEYFKVAYSYSLTKSTEYLYKYKYYKTHSYDDVKIHIEIVKSC